MAPTCCRLSFEMEGWLPWELTIYDGDSLVGSVPCGAIFTYTVFISAIRILLLTVVAAQQPSNLTCQKAWAVVIRRLVGQS